MIANDKLNVNSDTVAPQPARSKYLYKSVKKNMKQGVSNPIKYAELKKRPGFTLISS